MAEKKNWVDFKEIKARATIDMVLEHYGLLEGLKRSGKNLVGRCPIHKGTNPKQFSVNPEKNAFNCFGDCGGGGNVLDFVSKMEEVSIRDAGLLLQDWFGIRVSRLVPLEAGLKPGLKAGSNPIQSRVSPLRREASL
jgi:DNA primase